MEDLSRRNFSQINFQICATGSCVSVSLCRDPWFRTRDPGHGDLLCHASSARQEDWRFGGWKEGSLGGHHHKSIHLTSNTRGMWGRVNLITLKQQDEQGSNRNRIRNRHTSDLTPSSGWQIIPFDSDLTTSIWFLSRFAMQYC